MIVWIVSYPKSGNTWVRSFLSNYLNYKYEFDFKLLENIRKFPDQKLTKQLNIDTSNFINIASNWETMQDYINLKNSTTYLKTHSALITVNGNKFTSSTNTAGYIYLVRDPRDVILSLASHLNITIKQALIDMKNENNFEYLSPKSNHISTIMSSWDNNYNSWKKCTFVKGIIIKYEDLISDPLKTFSKIINYLNEINGIKIDNSRVLDCIQNTKFDNLKKIEDEKGFAENMNGKFFRKGIAGQWKKDLDKNIIDQIEKRFEKEMKELGYI
ncbi:sulfotransferase domain-containing protein [Candidatus Pelagibacter sp.]|nr:sulfotransferase domain-containing protein [Candidatus Pelagibacter sp.]